MLMLLTGCVAATSMVNAAYLSEPVDTGLAEPEGPPTMSTADADSAWPGYGGIAVGDLDGDRIPDLLVHEFAGYWLALIPGPLTGVVDESKALPILGGNWLGGYADLVSTDQEGDGGSDLWLGEGYDGSVDPDSYALLAGPILADPPRELARVDAGGKVQFGQATGGADVDGDGNVDLLVAWTLEEATEEVVRLFLGPHEGDISVDEAVFAITDPSPPEDDTWGFDDPHGRKFGHYQAIVDHDGDGVLDIFLADPAGASPIIGLPGDTRGLLASADAALQIEAHAGGLFSLGDVDGDGFDDLSAASGYYPASMGSLYFGPIAEEPSARRIGVLQSLSDTYQSGSMSGFAPEANVMAVGYIDNTLREALPPDCHGVQVQAALIDAPSDGLTDFDEARLFVVTSDCEDGAFSNDWRGLLVDLDLSGQPELLFSGYAFLDTTWLDAIGAL